MRVGLVSDTHGLFEPRLRDVFAGCDLILHAGDVVTPATLDELARIAPVRAVRGNNDADPAFEALPEIAAVSLGAVTALLVHRIGAGGRIDPAVARAIALHRAQVVVHGHSHRPSAAVEGGLLLVNPGSAGPRRFRLPRSTGILDVSGRRVSVRLVDVASARETDLQPVVTVRLGAAPRAPGTAARDP
jgi:putative phosphoesterase